jgi:glycosyltransferase involved in cell wall biosynthesis
MKILMLSTGMGLGGAETQICDLSARLIELGHEVHIAWLTGQPGLALPPKAKTHSLNIHKTPVGFIQAIAKIRNLYKTIKPDIVHAHMVHANLIARLTRLTNWPLRTWKNPRLICTAHSSNEGGQLLMWAYRLTDPLTDLTTHVSKQAADTFIAKGATKPDRIVVIPNGVNTEKFRPDIKARQTVRADLDLTHQTVIMAVGRLEPPKNHASLIRAFAQVHASQTNCHLVLVGDGSLRNELEDLVAIKQLAGSVSFLGVRHDIAALLNGADFVTLTSRFEGFPIAVAEAMATEKLVVATACGGVPTMLEGVGMVVPIEDDEALTSGLTKALSISPQARHTFGQSARQRVVTEYSINALTDTWLRLYAHPRS